jgi:hypothetical protein
VEVKVQDITVDTLDAIAREWEEHRLETLVGKSLEALGRELEVARVRAQQAEVRAKLRALRLFREFDWSAEVIAETLGLTKREVNKWLK